MANANASSGDQFQDLAFPPDYPASVAFVLRNLKNQKDETDAIVNAVRSRVTVLEGIAETSSGRITALETTVSDCVKKSSIQSLDPSTIKLSPASIKEFLVTMVNAMKACFVFALLVPTFAFGGGKDIYGNDLTRTNKLGYVDGDLTTVGDLADFGAANPSVITSVVEGLVHPWARAKDPPTETDPTVPYWAKQLDPPAETDPTVKEWAKADNPPAETDPTVPTWAKQENPPSETDPTVPAWAKEQTPPQTMTTNAVDALANSAVVTNALTVATTNRVAFLETSTNNLASSVTSLQSLKADRSTTYTKGETDKLLDGKVSMDGGIITGSLIIGNSSIEDDESLSTENCIRANGGFSLFSYSWYVNPKLKWMGEYFEDSISGYNGRIYIPYTDAPWIDAIKEGSVKGLALYSDLDGFLKSESDPVFTAWLDGSFSNAVLAVGLNVDTNAVAVLNEIADGFGGFPIEGTATTVGGLLAALAAAAAWLKKNKVGSFKSVGGASATVENGVAKLDDFFTDSNSLLIGTIKANAGCDDEKTLAVFSTFARMDDFRTDSDESDSFDIAITKLSQLLGEDVAA